jgi:DNA-binding NarL/FixJ family response regulator
MHSDTSFVLFRNNPQPGDQERMELSEVAAQLIVLVAVGLTDDEIATQLQIPQKRVSDDVARLLAKLGLQDRVEIVFYAYSDPAMYKRITAIANRAKKLTTSGPLGQSSL